MSRRLNGYVTKVGIFLIVLALIAGMAGCVNAPPSPNLEIRTWYDLDNIRNYLADNYTLMNDLDSTTAGYQELASPTANAGKGWEPIGWGAWAADGPSPRLYGEIFRGSFDGQDHEIRDLFINRSSWGGMGLFGCVGEEGVVKNLGMVNATVTVPEDVNGSLRLNEGTVDSLDVATIGSVGILVGFSMGNVSESSASGAVSGDVYVGGLVGENVGTVNSCHSTGNVTSTSGVGGLIGSNGRLLYAGTVVGSYSTGNVTGYEYSGGLVGGNVYGALSDCYSTGNVTGNLSVGGLAGYNHGTVSDCCSSGTVTGGENVGGLVGCNDNGTASNCYSSGTVTGDSSVGGLVGADYDGIVSNSFWDTDTSSQTTSAGGTGKNTTEMQDILTFSGAGWNITAVALNETNPAYIWNIVNNVTYPFLSWEL